MDLIALLPDSTDDEDDDVDSEQNDDGCCGQGVARPRSIQIGNGGRRTKFPRRGSIDVVSSREAQVSGVFSRSIPHRRGHWAGHIKVPILTTSSRGDVDFIRKLKAKNVEALRNLLERKGVSGTMVEHDDLHLSLSKYFSLQIAHLEPFVRRLEGILRQEPSTNLLIETARKSQEREVTQWDVVEHGTDETIVLLNEEKTRSFFCWRVRPTETLKRIVAYIDGVLKRYNQPVYYQPAHFHVSFASFSGNIIEALRREHGDCSCSCSRSDDDDDDDSQQQRFQASPNHVCDSSSVSMNDKTLNNDLKGEATDDGNNDDDDDDDDDCSSSSSSSLEESFVHPVHELVCTLGTTKEFVIPLRRNQEL